MGGEGARVRRGGGLAADAARRRQLGAAGRPDQLSTATARITDLANEKAQLGDENVASQQYLDYQTQVSAAAATVASALGQCVSGQEQLVGYLKDAEQYEAADLSRYERQVNALCADADDANEALQRELRP